MERIIVCMILFSLVVFSQQTPNFRLPKDSAPISYKLNFELYMVNRSDNRRILFNGKATIYFEIFNPTVNLTMHAYGLKFDERKTELAFGQQTFTPERHILVDDHQFLILNFRHILEPGNYFLQFEYSGEAYDYYRSQQGLFFAKYKNQKGEIEYIAATQFQPNFARRVFPCWDEPALKATFDISIRHSVNYTAISNMPVKEVNNTIGIDGEKLTSFEGTPPMSTYLVAFTVSTFTNITKANESISLWVSKESANKSAKIAYESIKKAYSIWENYMGTRSLPKLDIIGIPISFYDGSEGNWGLITLSNETLLINNETSAREFLNSMLIFRHEILHQWFGSLVSPNWWTDAWITDGLATYFQYHLFSQEISEQRVLDYALIDCHLRATFDYYKSESPPGKIKENQVHISDFVGYSHNRGAALMRMLSNLISKTAFNTGIGKLLRRYKLKTISTEDFWTVMQKSLNQSGMPYFDIKEKLEPFILNLGFPLINVERNYKNGDIILTQECLHKSSDIKSKWWIPINYAIISSFNVSSTSATHWMDPYERGTIIPGINPDDLVIFNIQGTAPYVVNYDTKSWIKIVKHLDRRHTSIQPLDRAHLLLDAYWSFSKGKIRKNLFKSLLTYLKIEREFIPWAMSDNIFQSLKSEKKLLPQFFFGLVSPLLEDQDIEDDMFTRYMKQVALDVKKDYDEFLRQQEEYLKSNPDDKDFFE